MGASNSAAVLASKAADELADVATCSAAELNALLQDVQWQRLHNATKPAHRRAWRALVKACLAHILDLQLAAKCALLDELAAHGSFSSKHELALV